MWLEVRRQLGRFAAVFAALTLLSSCGEDDRPIYYSLVTLEVVFKGEVRQSTTLLAHKAGTGIAQGMGFGKPPFVTGDAPIVSLDEFGWLVFALNASFSVSVPDTPQKTVTVWGAELLLSNPPVTYSLFPRGNDRHSANARLVLVEKDGAGSTPLPTPEYLPRMTASSIYVKSIVVRPAPPWIPQ
jgi:hypothetical protein